MRLVCSSALSLRIRLSGSTPAKFMSMMMSAGWSLACSRASCSLLTNVMLSPALYRLAYDRRLPASFAIVGNSRTPMTDEDYRARMREAVKQFSEDGDFDEELWKRFAANLHYVAGDVKEPNLYQALREKVNAT